MARIELQTEIAAPRQRCFDLARSVDLHVWSAARTGEAVVGGRSAGLLELGEQVVWRARHLGVRWTMAVRISAFDPPGHFRDSLVRGPLLRMDHDHYFAEAVAGTTLMRDAFEYRAPYSVLGRAAEVLLLDRHLRAFLERRNQALKAVAESDAWRQFLLT